MQTFYWCGPVSDCPPLLETISEDIEVGIMMQYNYCEEIGMTSMEISEINTNETIVNLKPILFFKIVEDIKHFMLTKYLDANSEKALSEERGEMQHDLFKEAQCK